MKNTIQETGAGVAIYSLGNIDIKDSYFTSNNFIIRAGTDHNKDGAITYSAGNTNIANTIFEENRVIIIILFRENIFKFTNQFLVRIQLVGLLVMKEQKLLIQFLIMRVLYYLTFIHT